MKFLSVHDYDKAEKDAYVRVSNRMIEAFQPAHFGRAGYPIRVFQEKELVRYIDVMHLLRFEDYFNRLLNGLTPHEFILYQRISEHVARLSQRLFQKKAIARCSLLGSMNVLRHIKYLWNDERPRILEIGPGCGYLGALLITESYPYASMDIAQAFYLYQNRLWSSMTGGIEERVYHTKETVPSLVFSKSPAVHIPWWHFARLTPELAGEIDVLTVNHAWCEMHSHAARFVLRLARAMLKDTTQKKAVLFEGWGATEVTPAYKMVELLYETGYVMVHNDAWITLFVPKENTHSSGYLPLPRPADSSTQSVHPANKWGPYYFSSSTNPLSEGVRLGRNESQDRRRVTMDEINAFHRNLLGSDLFLTDDERFWRFIFE